MINTHKDININTLDTHFRPELCGLQTQCLNNTYVRVCVVRVRVHIYIYIYIFFISLTKDFLNRVTQTWDEQYNKEDNI